MSATIRKPHATVWTATAAAIAFVGISAGAQPALAEAGPRCGPRADVIGQLAKRHSETPISIGVSAGGAVVELLSATDGNTWTMLVTSPEGRSCLLTHGERWTPVIPAADHIS